MAKCQVGVVGTGVISVSYTHLHIPRTEHTAEKGACFYEIRRYDISIMVVFVAHVLPRFRSRGADQPMIQKGPPAPARRLASFYFVRAFYRSPWRERRPDHGGRPGQL